MEIGPGTRAFITGASRGIGASLALALAERRGATTGKELITAMVAGYEIGHRVGSAATMSLFFRGFHPQGTSGVFVAAATAARMLGLDASAFQHALGIAGSQAGGLMAAQEGAMVKRFHCGRAAQSGIYAADLAQDAFTGITDVLEAAYGGYLSSYSDKPNPARLTDNLGNQWETLAVGYKPHASVTSIHSALDSMKAIMAENGLKADDVARVEAGLSPMTHVHCAWEYKAQGVTAAQMNLFFGLAVIAEDGVAFTEQFRQERLAEPRLLDFIRRVTAHVDPEIESMGAAFRHASRRRWFWCSRTAAHTLQAQMMEKGCRVGMRISLAVRYCFKWNSTKAACQRHTIASKQQKKDFMRTSEK
jgi:2-methylcitrate dehydratase PrpD